MCSKVLFSKFWGGLDIKKSVRRDDARASVCTSVYLGDSVCFITASWDAALPPITLLSVSIFCPGLVRLPPDWISLFRKRENGSLSHTRSAVWERPSQPPHRLSAKLFCSISVCKKAVQSHLERTIGYNSDWNGATWLLKVYWFHLSAALVAASAKLCKLS